MSGGPTESPIYGSEPADCPIRRPRDHGGLAWIASQGIPS